LADAESSCRLEVEQAKENVASLEVKLSAVQSDLSACLEQESQRRDELVALRSRLASLEELDERGEGLAEAARELLSRNLPDVIGQISDLFTVTETLELATAAAVGPRLQGVVMASRDVGRQQLERIMTDGTGRIFLACRGVDVSVTPTPAPDREGVLGYLAEMLTSGQPEPIHWAVSDQALCVKDLTIAHDLIDQGWAGVVVTLAGERVSAVTMEAGASDGEATLLRRRREIAQLAALIPAGQEAHQSELDRLSRLRHDQATHRAELDEAKVRGQKAEIERAKASKDVELAQRESQRLTQLRAQLMRDLEGLRTRLEDARTAEQDGRRVLLEVESQRQDRRQGIEDAESAVRQAQAARDEAVAHLHDLRARSMAREERVLSLKTVVSRLNRQLNEIEVRRQRVSEVGVDVQQRLTEIKEADAQNRARLAASEAEADERAKDLVAAKLDLEKQEDVQRSLNQAFESQRQSRDELRQKIGDLQLQIQSVGLRADAQAERLKDKYRVTVDQALARLAEAGEVTDEERRRLDELTLLLDKMGEVNLGAIEEFESVEERHVFLSEQRDDLLAGLKDLTQAIHEIDRASQTLFAQTFHAVNRYFQQLFPRLFRGGDAELLLQDPDDLLNTGIEMRVSPPGKKVQSVELMSGGEKAMCAIALIFAVFRHKPSPFCLLDEVDAPLDDANIGRFNDVVREIAQTSQIVLVTHNKRTMEIADVLYGVTMEESGVSKLVGVRMT
ncbi:MAG: hypothetical protein VX589_00255, partial [Myxococcota bacterium]|nr:hypothetical protein [Myxococcota bacterium]